MQVDSINLQQRYFSGTGSIGGIHLPDFNDKYVYTKKKSGISDSEYRRQIMEQAYKDYEKGKFQNKSEDFNRLMKQYVSEVSPDRKGIITSGLKAVSRNRQNVLKPIDFIATLLEGKVKYQKLPSGNSDYIEFYDKNGEMVATYSNNGWTMYTTNAEASRQTEMCMIYNEAWGNAKRGIPLASEETVNVDNMQSSFDAKAQQKIIPNKPQRTGRAVPTTMKQSCLPDVLMEHGIGLKNAEAVLEKYDGRIAFDCDEKEFRVVVILQSVSATNSR